MKAAEVKPHDINFIRNRLLVLILIAAIAGAASAAMALSSKAGTRPGYDTRCIMKAVNMPEAYYTSIRLREGDTLQTIASAYNRGGYYSDAEYMEAVKQVNQITHDNVHPGCYLVVIRFQDDLL